MKTCYKCKTQIESESGIELVNDDGDQVTLHGTCFIKSYPGDAYDEEDR